MPYAYTYPALLVVEEKHANRYFLLQREEDLVEAATKLVRQRYRTGWWYQEPQHPRDSYRFREEEQQELLALSPEEVTALPPSLREKALKVRRAYARALREHQEDLKAFETLKALGEASWEDALTMKAPNGEPLGYALLEARQDYEYEGFEVQAFEDLTEAPAKEV